MSCTAEVLENQTNFELFKSECKTDGAEGSIVYGLRAVRIDIKKEVYDFEDISCSKEAVMKLIYKLKDEGVSIDQIPYIIEDYIAEL